MVNYYLDTSAMFKCYMDEYGSDWLRAQISRASMLIVSQLLVVEITSALNRRVRENTLTMGDYQRMRDIVFDDCRTVYQTIALTEPVVSLACELMERHPLRGYDAIHLATALVAHHSLRARDLPGLTFLCADDRLVAAAAAEGLAVDNPNNHP
jgi:predicted nucleic acid-binding protein